MRFLANENFPGAAVKALEAAGHDVVWVRTAAPGSSDAHVLAWAVREERILLTFDKDFGELATATSLPPACGIILLRLPMPKPRDVGQQLAAVITARADWAGHFSVIEPVAFECGRFVDNPRRCECLTKTRRDDEARSDSDSRRPWHARFAACRLAPRRDGRVAAPRRRSRLGRGEALQPAVVQHRQQRVGDVADLDVACDRDAAVVVLELFEQALQHEPRCREVLNGHRSRSPMLMPHSAVLN
jgi:predicted nuclease of predicted toxin-antitoxin system